MKKLFSIPGVGLLQKYVPIDRFLGSEYEPPETLRSRDIAIFRLFFDFVVHNDIIRLRKLEKHKMESFY